MAPQSASAVPRDLAPAASVALPPDLSVWLEQHADALDEGSLDAATVLPRLAAANLFRYGVPEAQGGLPGTDIGDAIEAVSQVAEQSVASAFVAWGQRVFIEYLLRSPNTALTAAWLAPLLAGEQAGATALSNAMKFLSGIESLQIGAREEGGHWVLDGRMPWVTNLRVQGFLVAAAVTAPDGTPAVVALPHDIAGLVRSQDLSLLALQSSNTAALEVQGVRIGPEWLIHSDARQYLPRARPAFAGLQCGLSIGLARRALRAANEAGKGQASRGILAKPLEALRTQVDELNASLIAGVRSDRFVVEPWALFEIRIALAEAANQAVQLELQASGGAAYLKPAGAGFARRWREAAFLPIVTPSLVQLKTELAKREARLAAEAAA
ncbi:acyl-CoA dehydrogenase family protein [Achromobacter seleniivolatilans]|uniref:Acyl-CoA dehydrogenase family protein n=1 Tax=Achromobacter seleniivolatilans TaxID=3047478 RepID=A0ABY9M611_9BURK|nr:acyl-CoA dehydrogenase family protein [Achromobacter sp. R39]WMD22421.1 acyl-CoA dehydrogenase family protein [Achromobacter sp. R39]